MLAHISIDPTAITGDAVAGVMGMFIGGAGLLIVASIVAGRSELLPSDRVPFRRWVALVAACLSLGAAAIHFAVIGDHFAEYLPYGVAFAVLAWFQVGWAAAYAAQPRRRLALLAVLVNGGALVVWAASRLVGLPIGPEPGVVEPVGPLDLTAGALEITVIVLLAWEFAAASVRLRPPLPSGGAVVVLGSSALAVVLLTSTAFAAAGGDVHGGLAHEVEAPPSLDTSVVAPSARPAPRTPTASVSAVLEPPTALASPSPSVEVSTVAPTARGRRHRRRDGRRGRLPYGQPPRRRPSRPRQRPPRPPSSPAISVSAPHSIRPARLPSQRIVSAREIGPSGSPILPRHLASPRSG